MQTRCVKWSYILGQVCGSAKMHRGWVSCRLVHLYRSKACIVGRSFFKRGVWPLSVVKSDPAVDDAFGLEAVLQFVQLDGLLLQGPPQTLDKYVVEVSPPTIH